MGRGFVARSLEVSETVVEGRFGLGSAPTKMGTPRRPTPRTARDEVRSANLEKALMMASRRAAAISSEPPDTNGTMRAVALRATTSCCRSTRVFGQLRALRIGSARPGRRFLDGVGRTARLVWSQKGAPCRDRICSVDPVRFGTCGRSPDDVHPIADRGPECTGPHCIGGEVARVASRFGRS